MDASHINSILYEEWDPIGVKGWAPKDEYESYARQIARILEAGGSHDDVVALLGRARVEEMMLVDDHARNYAVASSIMNREASMKKAS